MTFSNKLMGGKLTYYDLQVPGYPYKGIVKYSPSLHLRIDRMIRVNIAEFSELGLIVDSVQLRFVACHAMPKLWISQLKELISPFDYTTWLVLITSIYTLSLIINSQIRKQFQHFVDRCVLWLICFAFRERPLCV